MIRLFLIIPLVTFGLWYLYLKQHGWTVQQGIKGFKIIAVFNVLTLSFFALMLYLTNM